MINYLKQNEDTFCLWIGSLIFGSWLGLMIGLLKC